VVPVSTIRPRYITATRSAMFQARPRSWVTTRTASPVSSTSRPHQREDLPADRGIELATGSSARRRRGSITIAPAITTRWRWPPDTSCGYRGRTAPGGRRPARLRRRATVPPRPRHPGDAQPLGDDLVDGLPRVEGSGRILEDHLDRRAAKPDAGRPAGESRTDRPGWAAAGPASPGSGSSCPIPTRRPGPAPHRHHPQRGTVDGSGLPKWTWRSSTSTIGVTPGSHQDACRPVARDATARARLARRPRWPAGTGDGRGIPLGQPCRVGGIALQPRRRACATTGRRWWGRRRRAPGCTGGRRSSNTSRRALLHDAAGVHDRSRGTRR
jgi:hypothetical protein